MPKNVVQPLTPVEPHTSVAVANLVSPAVPTIPTTPELSATTPLVFSTSSGAAQQLPLQTIAAMANQQAKTNGSATSEEKIVNGILPGVAGITLKQASQPGQFIKPGAGDFVNNLRQKAPGLPLDKVASPVTISGAQGVKNITDLTNNTTAQLTAVSNSIQTATVGLKNAGLISGDEQPAQVAGVIMGAALVGTAALQTQLQDTNTLVANVASGNTLLGKAISNGNFAGSLSDKITSGFGGVPTSLGGIANSNNSVLGKLVGQGKSAMQIAFSLAESSFGKLKANEPNVLGGGTNPQASVAQTLQTSGNIQLAATELASARAELITIKQQFEASSRYGADSATLQQYKNNLASAETRVAAAEQKLQQAKTSAISATPNGSSSAQMLETMAMSALSGQLNAPTSANTGANSLPGGLGAFANLGGGSAVSAVGTAKNLLIAHSPNFSAADLTGDIVGKLQQKLTSLSNQNLTTVTDSAKLLSNTTNTTNVVQNLTANAKDKATGIFSNLASSLNSIGAGPGQVKAATLATGTNAKAKAVINSVLNATLNPKVSATLQLPSATVLANQTAIQNNIKNLLEERKNETITATKLAEAVAENPNSQNIAALNTGRNKIAQIDAQIAVLRAAYNRTLV